MSFDNQLIAYEGRIPDGDEFLILIDSRDQHKIQRTVGIYKEDTEFNSKEVYNSVGVFLRTLYRVATCGYGCKGGSHLIEYITGRGYNLGVAALKLLRLGFYDESLSLVRSISEIVNLFALFNVKPEVAQEWYDMPEKERMRKYSPVKVRELLESTALGIPIAPDYYNKLCGIAVHINPQTKPQGNNHLEKAIVGGLIFREQAIATMLDLANNLCWLSIMSLRGVLDDELFNREMDEIQPLFSLLDDFSITNVDSYLKQKYGSQ